MINHTITGTVLLAFFMAALSCGNQVQTSETSSMKALRDSLKGHFFINGNYPELSNIQVTHHFGLRINETENVLTDEQCMAWVGQRPVLAQEFSTLNDCTGDSLYNIFYKDGLIVEEGIGDQLFFVGDFTTGNDVLRKGMTRAEIEKALGKPYKENASMLVYKKALHPEIAYLEGKEFNETVVLFLDSDRLVAIWVKFTLIC